MTRPRTKQRHARHITGDRGVTLVREQLPDEWVVRDIHPDYGLDLHIEVFEPDIDDPDSANTLGEHFYAQVKTTQSVQLEKVTVRSRDNVTKYVPDPAKGDPVEIEVAKLSLDTQTLLTVETMGAAVPVLLFYVDLSSKKVYYVCLNDYIAKSLLPYNPAYETQGSVTIQIPSWNVLDQHDPTFAYFWLLARRGKYYAAFNTFAYQFHELQRARQDHPMIDADEGEQPTVRFAPEILTMARTFLRTALGLAVWAPAGPGYWAPLDDVHQHLQQAQDTLPTDEPLPWADAVRFERTLLEGFRGAANLGRLYEELVREWRQPSYLATLLDPCPNSKHNPPTPAGT